MTRTTTWNVVLAFGDRRSAAPPQLSRPDVWQAACADTLDAVLATVEPTMLCCLTDQSDLESTALSAGARVDLPSRDINSDVTVAMARSLAATTSNSGLILLGPLPYLTPQTLSAALRACAAAESAVIVADDGGTVALSHHDATRLSPRFGGASAGRHTRTAVRVGEHLGGLDRLVHAGRAFPGRRLSALSISDRPFDDKDTP